MGGDTHDCGGLVDRGQWIREGRPAPASTYKPHKHSKPFLMSPGGQWAAHAGHVCTVPGTPAHAWFHIPSNPMVGPQSSQSVSSSNHSNRRIRLSCLGVNRHASSFTEKVLLPWKTQIWVSRTEGVLSLFAGVKCLGPMWPMQTGPPQEAQFYCCLPLTWGLNQRI